MAKKKRKRPSIATTPVLRKRAALAGSPPEPYKKSAVAAHPDPMKLRPSWHQGITRDRHLVAKLEAAGPYGFAQIDSKTVWEIKERLGRFESMTWNEILVLGKKFNHFVNWNRLASRAQARLEELESRDIDQLLSLRVGSRARIWGIFSAGVLELLWWDPEHQVCPSRLRHT